MPCKAVQWLDYISTSIRNLSGGLPKNNKVSHESGNLAVSRTCTVAKIEKITPPQFSALIRSYAARIWRAVSVSPLLLALIVVPSVALAQTSTPTSVDLVKNTDQTFAGNFGPTNDLSIGFTTGNLTSGYTLTAVKINFTVWTAAAVFSVDLYDDANGKPGMKVHSFTKPTTATAGVATFVSSATDGYTLTANTTYHIVFDGDGDWIGKVQLGGTAATAEDTGAATGWSIADDIHSKEQSSSASWLPFVTSPNEHFLQIAVVGYASPADPVVDISPSGPIDMVTGQQLTLDGSASHDPDGGNVAYSWTLKDDNDMDVPSASATLTEIVSGDDTQRNLSVSAAGTYVVTLTVTDDDTPAQTATATLTATVETNTLPTAFIMPTDTVITVLQDFDVELDGSGSDGNNTGDVIATYAWTVTRDSDSMDVTSDVLDNTDQVTTTFNEGTLGNYTVTLTVTDSGGSSGSVTKGILVTDDVGPIATITPSGDQSVTEGDDLELTATASEPGDDDAVITYQWSARIDHDDDPNTDPQIVTDDVLTGTTTATTTFNSDTVGVYDVFLTVTDDDSDIDQALVEVTVTERMQALNLSAMTASVNENGGTGSWTVALNTQPVGGAVTVTVASGDTSVATVSPTSLTFTATNWNTPQTVTVTGVDDDVKNATDRTAMITHTASGADYASVPVVSVTVTATDDDIARVVVSETMVSVPEAGGTDTWTVKLNTEPTGAVTVSISSDPTGVATVSPTSLSFDATSWSTPQTVTVTGVDDVIDHASERMATITHDASGADYATVPDVTLTVTAVDDDMRGVTVVKTDETPLTTPLMILEGGSDSYTVVLDTEPTTGNVTVQVVVGASTGGMRTVTASETNLMFTKMNWNVPQTVTLSVAPVDDEDADAVADTTLSVSHTLSSGGYSGVTAASVAVFIPGLLGDDDGGAYFMVQNRMINVPEDSSLPDIGGIQLSFIDGEVPTSSVYIYPEVPEEEPRGYSTEGSNVGAVNISFKEIGTTLTGRVKICLPRKGGGRVYRWKPADDMMPNGRWEVLDPPEDDVPTDYACGLADRFSLFAAGDEPAVSISKSRLAQLGRAMAGQVVDAVQNRLSASREAGFKATMAGQALPSFGESSHLPAYANTPRHDLGTGLTGKRDWENTRVQSLTEQSLLSGSSFSVTDKFLGAGSVSVWGQASITGFDGEGLDDGQMTSGFFGADWTSDELTAGVALSLNRGKGTWTSDDEGEEFKSSVTGLHPYFGYELSNRLSVWGVAGYGEGDIETMDGSETTSVDTDMLMVAGGTNGDLESSQLPASISDIVGDDVSLALNSDVLWVRMGTDAEDASASRLRVAVEASWLTSTDDGIELKPTAEVGLRLDGGDAETGFGLDIGGGVGWSDASRGMSAGLRGRVLLTHASDDLREQSISGSFGWDPNPGSAEGMNLTVSYTVGDSATGGSKALFSKDTLSAVETIADNLDNHRMEIRLGYGMPVWGGRFIGTPQTTFGYSDDKRDVSLGWRMTLVDRSSVRGTGSLGLSVEARRSESASDGYRPEDEIVFRLRTQF